MRSTGRDLGPAAPLYGLALSELGGDRTALTRLWAAVRSRCRNQFSLWRSARSDGAVAAPGHQNDRIPAGQRLDDFGQAKWSPLSDHRLRACLRYFHLLFAAIARLVSRDG